MSLRDEVHQAIEDGRLEDVERWVADEPKLLRFLMGLTYRPEERIRERAARCIAAAGNHHPKLVQNNVRRLVWAMNDESGANALTAPAVILAIARETPELLLPMVPDLVRLAGDPGLYEGLAAALSIVKDRCPGKLGKKLQDALNKKINKPGGCDDCGK